MANCGRVAGADQPGLGEGVTGVERLVDGRSQPTGQLILEHVLTRHLGMHPLGVDGEHGQSQRLAGGDLLDDDHHLVRGWVQDVAQEEIGGKGEDGQEQADQQGAGAKEDEAPATTRWL